MRTIKGRRLVMLALLICAVAQSVEAAPRRYWKEVERINHGDYVAEEAAIQFLLRARGYKSSGAVEGIFDRDTEKCVRRFQRLKGLKVSGIVNGPTWEKLIVTVRKGERGHTVRAMQTLLVTFFSEGQKGYNVPVDGIFGAGTLKALRAFQGEAGLKADGIAGPDTWCLLARGSIGQPIPRDDGPG